MCSGLGSTALDPGWRPSGQHLLHRLVVWKYSRNHISKALDQAQGLIFATIGDPGITLCDEYHSVMGLSVSKKIRFANGIKSTNKGNAHLFVSLNVPPNNE